MTPEEIDVLLEEQGEYVFERMFAAVEKVRERLERTCRALAESQIPYAVVGGNAVAAWVATVDQGAVRNTRDVDILLREVDLDRAEKALASVGFLRDIVMGVTIFLDGPQGKPSEAIHVLIAGKKVRHDYVSATPLPDESRLMQNKRIVDLEQLVIMKLNSYRRKDQVHLLDLIQVGLIDASWPQRLEPELGKRLQALLDDPEG